MLRFANLYVAVLAAFLIAAVTADVMRVPLRKRAHSGHRLVDRDGAETDVVNMSALRRSINHVNRRYGPGAQEDQAAEKRWVSANVLNKDIDLAFAKQDDDVQNNLFQGVKDVVGQLLPSTKSTSSVVSSKSKSRVTRKSKGRYAGALGSATTTIDLEDNVSGGTDIEFVGDISIGTPAQTFPIDPDTGSADLWVVDSTCTADACGPNSRGKFQDDQSSTYAPISSPAFDLQYGVGDVSGSYTRETVRLGSITLKKQIIGLANYTSPDWKTDKASGVLGLGFRSITSAGQRPVIQNLARQAGLKKKVISFAFGRYLSNTQGKSEMLIGNTNKALYKGKITYYALSKVAYWQAKVKTFGAGTNAGVTNVDGIFDTGTSLIAAPSSIAAAFWKGVPNSSLSDDGTYYVYPCSQTISAKITMPDGKAFTLSEKDINLGRETTGSSQCVGSVIVANTPGQVIYGLAALKNFYTVFDFGKNRIGMAQYSF
jgi:cathepsin D